MDKITIVAFHRKYHQRLIIAAALSKGNIDSLHRLNPESEAVLKLEPTSLAQAHKIDIYFFKRHVARPAARYLFTDQT